MYCPSETRRDIQISKQCMQCLLYIEAKFVADLASGDSVK